MSKKNLIVVGGTIPLLKLIRLHVMVLCFEQALLVIGSE
jgi:hypothetical protein